MTTNIPEPSTPPRAPDVESWRGTKPAASVQEGIAALTALADEMRTRPKYPGTMPGVRLHEGQKWADRLDEIVARHHWDRPNCSCGAANPREFRAPVTEPVAVDEDDRAGSCPCQFGDPCLCAQRNPTPPVSDDTTTDETVDFDVMPIRRRDELIAATLRFMTERGYKFEMPTATPSPVGGVSDDAATVLAEHRWDGAWGDNDDPETGKFFRCTCGWTHRVDGMNGWDSWRARHDEHVVAVLAAHGGDA